MLLIFQFKCYLRWTILFERVSQSVGTTDKFFLTCKLYFTPEKLPVCKAVADGPVGQILAGPLFLKVKTKFHFTESK